MKNKNILKYVSLVIGALLMIFTIIPVLCHNFHIGVIMFGAMALFFFLMPNMIEKYKKEKNNKFLKIFMVIGCIGSAAVFLFCGYLHIYGDMHIYNDEKAPTVIVLGCKVYDSRPSLSLKYRLDAALDVLKSYEKSNCVVSGGKSVGDRFSEAEVMEMYLVKNGISKERIFKEDRSDNTETNLKYSSEIIYDNNLNNSVVICSDRYHLLRASLYGKKYNLKTYTKGGKSPWGLAPTYYAREIPAVLKQIVFDL